MHCWYLTIPPFTRNAGWPRRICSIRNRLPREESPGRCETGTCKVTSGHIRTRQYLAAASGSSSGYEDIFIIHDPISTLSPLPDEVERLFPLSFPKNALPPESEGKVPISPAPGSRENGSLRTGEYSRQGLKSRSGGPETVFIAKDRVRAGGAGIIMKAGRGESFPGRLPGRVSSCHR